MIEKEMFAIKKNLSDASQNARNSEEIEELRVKYLGKKGELTQILKGLGKAPHNERARIGALANRIKSEMQSTLEERKKQTQEEYYQSLAKTEWVDMTVQPAPFPQTIFPMQKGGHIHPISLMQQKLENIFSQMGFNIFDGPQLEEDFYNFGALNFSDDHPARDTQDTFYSTHEKLLRTHTSSVQIRVLLNHPPPIRMIAPGRVFRNEEVDASHEHTFYQIEGMVIDKSVNVSNLLFLMKTLLEEVFSSGVDIRLRPGYFPFVEPSFELDVQCLICKGTGCSTCKKSGWIEILPCGVVHPNVIQACGLNKSKWQGIAFGLGLNRLVMMNHGIEDIRHFQTPNPDFLKMF